MLVSNKLLYGKIWHGEICDITKATKPQCSGVIVNHVSHWKLKKSFLTLMRVYILCISCTLHNIIYSYATRFEAYCTSLLIVFSTFAFLQTDQFTYIKHGSNLNDLEIPIFKILLRELPPMYKINQTVHLDRSWECIVKCLSYKQ